MMFDHDESLDEARARNVRDALFEDIGRADWTGLLVPAGKRVAARVVVREEAILCGRDWFEACLHALDGRASVNWQYDEGARMAADTPVCTI
jgi:nicotinate-nucleotide pyrophosphorylase (carboxylating)